MSAPPPFPQPALPGWLTYDTLLHSRCGRKLSEHPIPHAAAVDCPFPELPPVHFTETAVKLCLFRTCNWRVTADAPPAVLDELIARHLLSEHRTELVILGCLAEQGDLL